MDLARGIGHAMFSIGRAMFSAGHTMFSVGHVMFSTGHTMFSVGHTMFLIGHTMSAFFSHSSLRKVPRKPKILNRMWCNCCFYLRWILCSQVTGRGGR